MSDTVTKPAPGAVRVCFTCTLCHARTTVTATKPAAHRCKKCGVVAHITVPAGPDATKPTPEVVCCVCQCRYPAETRGCPRCEGYRGSGGGGR